MDTVDAQIDILRVAHSYAFHTRESLATRCFFDQPKHELPYSGFDRPGELGKACLYVGEKPSSAGTDRGVVLSLD